MNVCSTNPVSYYLHKDAPDMGKIELLDGNNFLTRSKTVFIHSRVIYAVYLTGSASK